uniref:Uncharacterized protein n=1 Tax=Chondrus crispus TaxID=2769 RepID=Q36337_CHOCR|nr:hypothetical protein ChcroMp51 [Chondrus crispus]CAA87620.1 unnamed protein product [Chondrus crispus]
MELDIPSKLPDNIASKKKPTWLIELYAIKRFHLIWENALKVPIIIENIIQIKIMILQKVIKSWKLSIRSFSNKLKIASFGIIEKNNVIDVGDPS